jgi:NAD(P) transhydrogenase subunit beta
VWSVLIEPGAGEATRRSAVEALGAASATSSAISVLVGGLTFTGSLIAFLKLRGSLAGGRAVIWPARHALNALLAAGALAAAVVLVGWAAGASAVAIALLVLTAVALVLGATLVLPIGGADMPVVVSLLNSYSGVAAAAAGFVIGNPALVVAGAMVGAAGLILTNLMCKAMNRSLVSVLVGGFGMEATEAGGGEYVGVKSATPEEAAMVLEAARSVILVPGYGLAVAQAQHAVRELSEELRRRGIEVRYAIHPVAGRMPGHMNVLLAEADVPYEQLFERDAIDQDFRATDVAIVVGANDVVNPAAIEDPKSPIYGMPILSVHEARTVFVIKRSLASGYAGIKNALFERDNTSMIFGDARQVVQGMVTALREGT